MYKRQIETYYPGFLVAQDTYYVGHIKGVGHIYQQTVIDTYSKIYGDKVELYSDDSYSLDKLLGISTKLEKACEKKVWLKSCLLYTSRCV